MSSPQGERIQAHCRTIWGPGTYDLDINTDDHMNWQCSVRKDFGLSFGPYLTMTSLCSSSGRACDEMERILGIWARQVQSGLPPTKEESLDIFGGSRGEHRNVLKRFMEEMERRGERAQEPGQEPEQGQQQGQQQGRQQGHQQQQR